MKHALVLALLFPSLVSTAAELGELQAVIQPEDGATFIVRDPQVSVLIVRTTVTPLSFDCNMGIARVENPSTGEYRLRLLPGTNLVTFKAEGYLPLRERFYLERKSALVVRVSPKPKSSAEARPEIRLIYQPAGRERVAGTLDGKILNLDFSRGSVSLRPEAGTRVVQLVSGGRVWQKSYSLGAGESASDSVLFSGEVVETAPPSQPGGLYISSPVPGVKVYLNDLFQGITPLTLDSVPVGEYDLRLERSLYLPSFTKVTVRSLDFAAYEVALTPNFGILGVESDPSGALAQIEGAERGATPLAPQRLDAGSYQLRLTRPFFHPLDTLLQIHPGDTLALMFALKPRFGSLAVTSDPSGARLLVDGREAGLTPVSIDTLPAGSHLLTISAKRHHDQEEEIVLKEGDRMNRHYSLAGAFGRLTILGSPQGAKITLQGEEALQATLPLEGAELLPGIYRISIEEAEHDPFNDVVVLEEGRSDTLRAELTRWKGLIQVSSTPQGAIIYLDEIESGRTPTFLHDVPTGGHILRLDLQGYDISEDSIVVKRLETTPVEWVLSAEGTKRWRKDRLAATAQSALIPTFGQFRRGQVLRGGLWAGALIGATAMAFDAKNDHRSYRDDFERAQSDYRAAIQESDAVIRRQAVSDARDRMLDADNRWRFWLVCAGGIWIGQAVDAWLFGAGERPRAHPGPRIEFGLAPKGEPAGASVCWTYTFPAGTNRGGRR